MTRTCPDCGHAVVIWKRVCFGPDAHNEYRCWGCGWNGRNPKLYGRRFFDLGSAQKITIVPINDHTMTLHAQNPDGTTTTAAVSSITIENGQLDFTVGAVEVDT